MVFGAAGDERLEFVFVGNAAEVRPQIILDFRWDQIESVFRGEDAVHEVGNVGVRHGESVERAGLSLREIIVRDADVCPKLGSGSGVPTARASLLSTLPALKRRANISRPYGTRCIAVFGMEDAPNDHLEHEQRHFLYIASSSSNYFRRLVRTRAPTISTPVKAVLLGKTRGQTGRSLFRVDGNVTSARALPNSRRILALPPKFTG